MEINPQQHSAMELMEFKIENSILVMELKKYVHFCRKNMKNYRLTDNETNFVFEIKSFI